MDGNTADLTRAKNEEERQANIRRASDATDEHKHPCLNEQSLVYNCLTDGSHNKKECDIYVQNYRRCREFWTEIEKDRRRKGIKPHLPWPEEREKIKKEYMSHWK